MTTDDTTTPPPDAGNPGVTDESAERSAAFLRAAAVNPSVIAGLAAELHRRVHDVDSLIDLMHRASREAVRMIPGVQWAGVTAQFAGPPFTAAHTDTRVLIVDEGQYGQGDGPCLQALRTDRVVTMSSEQVSKRWPVLADAIHDAGVRAFHAEPLHVRDRAVGALNLYSANPGGLAIPNTDVLTVLTEYLDHALTDFSAAQPGDVDARRLQDMLRTRFVIHQAVGSLMAAHGIDDEAARLMLYQTAAEQDLPVAKIAGDMVARRGVIDPTEPDEITA